MRHYEIRYEGASETIEAADMAEAEKKAEEWLRGGSWDRDQTLWLTARIRELPPYTADQLNGIDAAIDAFTDAWPCWSINDVENGTLDSPAADVPQPTPAAIKAARWLGVVRHNMRAVCEDLEESSVTVTLHPEEPECIDDDGHDWQSPHSIVGGIKENPGVWGHGGGVNITEVCVRCGCGRHTDTWAQHPETGEQGLTSVRYEPREFAAEIGEPA